MDDVFQNAMLRLHKALNDISPATVRDWTGLAGLQIRRELLNLARKQKGPKGKVTNAQTGGLGDGGSSSSPGWEPVANTDGPATLARWTEFHELVGRLPPELQEVFSPALLLRPFASGNG